MGAFTVMEKVCAGPVQEMPWKFSLEVTVTSALFELIPVLIASNSGIRSPVPLLTPMEESETNQE